MDKEKVIKGLKCLITDGASCNGCLYYGRGYCVKNIASDALGLLKEREPVQVVWKFAFPYCPECGQMLPEGDRVKYCFHCGREVKWE